MGARTPGAAHEDSEGRICRKAETKARCPTGSAQLGDIEQPRVYPLRRGFGDAINRVRLLPTHPDLDDAGIVLHQLANGLPAEPPQLRKLANAKVLFGVAGI